MKKKTIRKKVKSKINKSSLPTIIKGLKERETIDKPLIDHYSYSSLVKFSTNPFMFKVKYINGDNIDTAHSPASVIGKAFHVALQRYYEAKETEEDEIKVGLETGMT